VFIQAFNWKYRFFKRELPALLRADPVLGERFRQTHEKTLTLIRSQLETSHRGGTLVPLPERDRNLLAEALWLVSLFWLTYLETAGEEVTDASTARGVDVLRLILGPYPRSG